MKKIRDLIKANPVSCGKNETVKTISTQMFKSNVGFLPVVDENKKVIGAITDRDVALSIGKIGKDPQDVQVQDIMNTTVHTIHQDEDISDALKLMRTKKVGRLPVVDSEKKLKGVISVTGIACDIKDSDERSELEHAGPENVMSTIHSLGDRTRKAEKMEEPVGE